MAVMRRGNPAGFRPLLGRPIKVQIWSSEFLMDIDVRYSTQIKPISYLKASAAEVLRELTRTYIKIA
jgi:hypothetical protein